MVSTDSGFVNVYLELNLSKTTTITHARVCVWGGAVHRLVASQFGEPHSRRSSGSLSSPSPPFPLRLILDVALLLHHLSFSPSIC